MVGGGGEGGTILKLAIHFDKLGVKFEVFFTICSPSNVALIVKNCASWKFCSLNPNMPYLGVESSIPECGSVSIL